MIVVLALLLSMRSYGQEKSNMKPIKIDCVAFGTQTQMGKTFNVKIHIRGVLGAGRPGNPVGGV